MLERLGHEVDFPEDRTCCGQMHANPGFRLERVEGVHGPRLVAGGGA